MADAGVDWTGLGALANQNQFDYQDMIKNLAAIGQAQVAAQSNAYKLRAAQRADEVRSLIAKAVGQGDYAGAQQQALAIGDSDMAKQIAALSDTDTKTAAAHAGAVASAASILRARPIGQRPAAFDAIVPGLKSAGLSDQEIAAGQQHIADRGWSDDVLDGYVSTHQTVKDLAEQQLKDRQLADAEHKQQWEENKVTWVTPPAGGYVQGVRSDGTMLGQPVSGDSPDSATPPTPTPGVASSSVESPAAFRGVPVSTRQNNPGALRYDGRSQWKGMVGQPQPNQFLQFDTVADGQRAQIINLQNQARLHGISTLADLTAKYAPAADGNDPVQYAATLGHSLGIDPHAAINFADPQLAQRVAGAMAQVEAGGSPAGGTSPARLGASLPTQGAAGQVVGGRIYGPAKQAEPPSGYQWAPDGRALQPIPGGPAAPTSPSAAGGAVDPKVDFLARGYLQSHKLPALGMGRDATALRQAVFARVAELAQQRGISPEQAGLAGADFASTSKSLAAVEQQQAFVATAERTTLDNLQIWNRAASALPGQTRYPLVNSLVQFGAQHLGNTDVHPAEDALETVANEYAKVMSGNASGSGPTSDNARAHAKAMLSNADSPQARAKVIATLTSEMRNRTTELEQQRQSLRQRIVGGGGGSGSIPPAAIAYLRQNPRTRAQFDQKFGAGASTHVLGW